MVLPLGDVERTRITPWVTYTLIALNVLVFLVQKDEGPAFTAAYAATPYEITRGEDIAGPFALRGPPTVDGLGRLVRVEREVPQAPVPFPVCLTLFTAMFLHGSELHLAGNLLYLWIFGDNVEEVLGPFRYLAAYLGCGLAGGLAQVAAAPDSLVPTLGASGAVAGVMGAYLVWFPDNRVRVLVVAFLTELPAAVVIGAWIALQIWQGLGAFDPAGPAGGVAYLAHVGGALAGIAVACLGAGRARTRAGPDRFDFDPGRP